MSNTATRANQPLALNFEFTIDDHHGDPAPLAADVAKQIAVKAGIPVVGLVTLTSFDGMFQADVPQEWYDELEESGDDFDTEVTHAGLPYTVHAVMY